MAPRRNFIIYYFASGNDPGRVLDPARHSRGGWREVYYSSLAGQLSGLLLVHRVVTVYTVVGIQIVLLLYCKAKLRQRSRSEA